jgi:hypothetical protein
LHADTTDHPASWLPAVSASNEEARHLARHNTSPTQPIPMMDRERQGLIMTEETMLTRKTPRLTGLLRLISSQSTEDLRCFDYEPHVLTDSQNMLKNRRRSRLGSPPIHSQTASFEALATHHRYVCFFVIQGNASNFYSQHCLFLRQRLSQGFHDVMKTFLVCLGDDAAADFFCHGTGFCHLPETPLVRSLLNISQVPCVIIVNSTTGEKMSQDAMLAMEWNDAHRVINSWQRGQSGLTCTQKMMAVATFQSSCAIQ